MRGKTLIEQSLNFIKQQQGFLSIRTGHKANNSQDPDPLTKSVKKHNISSHNDLKHQKAPDLKT
jgi:hypothetical protein